MYAIVDIAGQQFKVSKADKIYVHRLDAEVGSKVEFDKVMLIDNEKKVDIGAPLIKGTSVLAEVVEHLKGDKVLVFKKKRRKGYSKLNGHRQYLTCLNILSINKDGSSISGDLAKSIAKIEKAEVKSTKKTSTKEKTPKAEVKVSAKTETKTETKTKVAKAEVKETVKKPVAKKVSVTKTEVKKTTKKPAAKTTTKAVTKKATTTKKTVTTKASTVKKPVAKKTSVKKEDKKD